jgi:minor extracellular serine protease Vpr
MRRALLATTVALLALSSTGTVTAGPNDGLLKMDPSMRVRLLRSAVRGSANVAMFVKTTDVAATRKEIERLGGHVGTVAGDILTVRVPETAVATLAARKDVSRLEAARKVTQRLDKVLVDTKVDQVHSGGAGTPFKGAGVVVGVVDAGFDATHEAFRKPGGGGSRVVAFWDQTATTGPKPAGFSYGAECTTAQLTDNSCPHAAPDTHGTHVAGIAAGGPVQGTPYLGMAPEADIAFVNLGSAPGAADEDAALTTAICDGASFIFKAAAALGKPAVVNMSLGEHTGPHDGTSLADQCLDNLTGAGKIIVAAAGNEGQGSQSGAPGNPAVFVHASGTASANPSTVRFHPSVSNNVIQGDLVVWTDSPGDLTVRIGVTDGNATTFSSPVTRTQPLNATSLTVGAFTVGPVVAAGGELPSGARGTQIRVSDGDNDKAELQSVTWILEVTGTGKFDAFLDTTNTGGFIQSGIGAGVTADNMMTIGFPGIASKVIAVGSHVTRNEWTPLTGGPQQQTNNGQQVTIGALSGFSSRGPARRTTVVTQKPEITAPGEIVVSALNSRGTVPAERIMKASPNGFYLAEGTSMATPAVAGIVALMLQKEPRLTVADVKSILAKTATPVAGETLPNTSWGAGKANALAAVMAVSAPTTPGSDAGPAVGNDASAPPPSVPGSPPNDAGPAPAAPAGDSGGCNVALAPGGAGGAAFAGLAVLFAFAARLRRRAAARK